MNAEKKEKLKNIPVIFQQLKEYEKDDNRFLKLKIWLMHTGRNYNNSSFSKESVEKAIPTLANTPLLAFIEDNEDGVKDFSDHRMDAHKDEHGKLSLRYKGEAVGVIPESHNAKWETRVSDLGDELEYITVEALMWTKKDEPIDIMRRRGFTFQSMELADDFTGEFDEEGVFHFEDFKFFGACLLGEGVSPAMDSSTAEIHFSQDDNQSTIERKLKEFNTLFSKGGDNMTEKTELDNEKKNNPLPDEELEPKKEFEDGEDESEGEGEEGNENEGDNGTDPENGDDGDDNGGNGDGDGTEEPDPEPEPEEPEIDTSELEGLVNSSDYNSDDYTDESYDAYNQALADANNTLSNTEATQDDINSALQALQDAINGLEEKPEPEPENKNNDSDDETSANPMKKRKKITDFEEKYEKLSKKFEELEVELGSLREYKRSREEQDIKDKFSGRVSEDEFAKTFSKMKDSSIEDIEKELFAIIGQKEYSNFSSRTETEKINSILIPQEEEKKAPYSALEIYLNKE